jgi:hypothetical protein
VFSCPSRSVQWTVILRPSFGAVAIGLGIVLSLAAWVQRAG